MKNLIVLVCYLFLAITYVFSYNPNTFEEHQSEQERFYLDEFHEELGELYLSYVDAGPSEGRPLLLVHGVPTSSWSFRKMTAKLAALGYRVIAPDNLGFGGSAKPTGKSNYRLDLQGDRLLKLMKHLNIDSWIQVLHDVGGPITWEMMAESPGSIEGLVILNTFAYETGWHPPKSLDNPVVQFSLGVIGFKSKAVIRTTICDMLTLPELVDNETTLTGYYEPLQNGADEAYLAFMTSFDAVRARLPFYRRVLKNSEVPGIIIWGDNDETLVGSESIPLFVSDLGISVNDVFIRGDAKHLIMEEIPSFIVDRILIFAPPVW